MSICEKSDLATEMCSHCKGLDDRPTVSPALPTTLAKYAGICTGGCDNWVQPNDVIYRVCGEWVCFDCAAEAI